MLYRDLDDDALRAAYRDARNAAYLESRLAQSVSPRSRGGRGVAARWGRNMRAVEIIEAIARRRGIRLTQPPTKESIQWTRTKHGRRSSTTASTSTTGSQLVERSTSGSAAADSSPPHSPDRPGPARSSVAD